MTLDTDDIVQWIEQLEKESKAIKKDVIKLIWYMRGGITLTEAMHLSIEERKIISDLINDNLETTKKTGMPFF